VKTSSKRELNLFYIIILKIRAIITIFEFLTASNNDYCNNRMHNTVKEKNKLYSCGGTAALLQKERWDARHRCIRITAMEY
jgi:hypothetical protein